MPLAAATTVGPYEILAPIGAGGMGEVYKARDTRLGRDVALKVLPEAFSKDASRRARFETEARAASALNHPGIVTVYDIGSQNGIAYIATEFVDGATLRQSAPESLRRQLDIAAQVAEALAAAHAAGITHRDLKPENIMVTGPRTADPGRAKILDFGLARQNVTALDATLTAAITNPGALMGTIGYLSPEQAHGRAADHRSDIFSLGAVLYELFSGKRAFDGESPAAILSAVIRGDPLELPDRVPAGVRSIIERCLDKEPARRFQSTQDLAFALRAVAGSKSSAPSTDSASAIGAAPDDLGGAKRRASSRVAMWLTAAAAAVAIVFGVSFWRLATEPPRVDTSNFRFRPFATDEYYEQEPVWSPDGKSIAYVARPKADYELTVKGVGGGSPFVVASSHGVIRHISWVPDGSRLYYTDENGSSGVGKLFSVARAGGEPIPVQPNLDFGPAAISPDGKTLAAMVIDRPARKKYLTLSSPPEAAGRRIAEFPGLLGANYLNWSHDGDKLLVDYRGDGAAILGSELLVLDVASGGLRKVATTPSSGGESWLADDRHALVAWPAGDGTERLNLWVLDTRSRSRTPVLPSVGYDVLPSVNVEGTVAYTSWGVDRDLMELPLDGSPPKPLLATRQDEYGVAWSPVSPEFAYVREGAIHIRRRDGSEDRVVVAASQFPGEARLFFSPVFSPDGTRLLYTTLPDRKGWISPVGGGPPAPLGDFDGPVRSGAWSPDGKWIALNWSGRLAKVLVGSRDKPQVLYEQECGFAPSWSPDGSEIVCADRSAVNTLLAILAGGGKPAPLGSGFEALAAWSTDIRYIYAIRNAGGKRQLGRLDRKGGGFQQIVEIPAEFEFTESLGGTMRLSLAPDGKSLATTVQKETGDIWLLYGLTPPPTLWQRLWGRHAR